VKKVILCNLLIILCFMVYAETDLSGGLEFSILCDHAQLEAERIEKINHIKTAGNFYAMFDQCFFIGGEVSALRELEEGNVYNSLAIYQIDPAFIFGFQIYSFSCGMRGSYEIPFGEENMVSIARQKNEIFFRLDF